MDAVHVIVVGCGRVGSELAIRLSQSGNSVVVIDKEPRSFRRIPETWTGKKVVGFGFDQDTLALAGVDKADALAAVTSGDNTNILTARIARETFEIPNVIARIYDPRRAVIYQRLGIQTVATVTWTTDQILRRLNPDAFAEEWSTSTGELVVIEKVLPEVWAGRRLMGIELAGESRIISVTRADSSRIPTPETVGQEGDVLHIAIRRDSLARLEATLQSGEVRK